MSIGPRRRLNQKAKGIGDGQRVPCVDLSHFDGIKTHFGFVWVYWPFVVFRCADERTLYNVTHAPSGAMVRCYRTKREAVSVIQQLRATKADWDFYALNGVKAKRAIEQSRGVVPPLQRVA